MRDVDIFHQNANYAETKVFNIVKFSINERVTEQSDSQRCLHPLLAVDKILKSNQCNSYFPWPKISLKPSVFPFMSKYSNFSIITTCVKNGGFSALWENINSLYMNNYYNMVTVYSNDNYYQVFFQYLLQGVEFIVRNKIAIL